MRFRLLGPVEAESDGRPVELGGPKKQLLLAVLLEAEGRPVTPSQLLQRVWHEGLREGSTPQETVQSGVRNLRNALGRGEPGANELIPKKDPRYRMTARAGDVDLHRFRVRARRLRPLVARGDAGNDPGIAALGREALAEWRQGPVAGRGDEALAGLDGHWADGVRKELVMQYHEVLVACLGAEIRLGHGPRLVPELEELHQARPLNRQLALHLMRACHLAGDRQRVIEVYERFQRRVERRYSAGPDPAARDLYRRIVEDDPTLRPRVAAPPGAHPGAATGSAARAGTGADPGAGTGADTRAAAREDAERTTGENTEATAEGARMSSSGKPDIAGEMLDLLAPALPVLTGRAPENANGAVPSARARELWRVLQIHEAVSDLPEAWRNSPDPDTLHAQLADVVARDGTLAEDVAAILAGRFTEHEKGQITNFGQYYQRGDNILGTSIKNYHR
ncbi:winged helix-turn-helix domain-containing protein [Actinomadura graeca]|uniref:Winged helix-turn-helix domain-containing protein n=1 Tax=Actinomadura graeca TaxID=2750812 RepID=A0ABX8QU56_9ACTN|nr:bacterial transcriptional activator domain-containing protein [Actinomadura graeca]QXJ20318.1 winged helix-turn-helix domain-containing protein [Actinomadura graeca]